MHKIVGLFPEQSKTVRSENEPYILIAILERDDLVGLLPRLSGMVDGLVRLAFVPCLLSLVHFLFRFLDELVDFLTAASILLRFRNHVQSELPGGIH